MSYSDVFVDNNKPWLVYDTFFPVNLIATAIKCSEGKNVFKYRTRQISLKSLKMYARFADGIPPGIDLASIK